MNFNDEAALPTWESQALCTQDVTDAKWLQFMSYQRNGFGFLL